MFVKLFTNDYLNIVSYLLLSFTSCRIFYNKELDWIDVLLAVPSFHVLFRRWMVNRQVEMLQKELFEETVDVSTRAAEILIKKQV